MNSEPCICCNACKSFKRLGTYFRKHRFIHFRMMHLKCAWKYHPRGLTYDSQHVLVFQGFGVFLCKLPDSPGYFCVLIYTKVILHPIEFIRGRVHFVDTSTGHNLEVATKCWGNTVIISLFEVQNKRQVLQLVSFRLDFVS